MKLDHFVNAVASAVAHRDRYKTKALDRVVCLPDGTPVGGLKIEQDRILLLPRSSE